MGETTTFDTLPSTGTDYAAAVESLTERFDPSTNKDMEIHEFRQIFQESGETTNEFYRRLKEKLSSCESTNAEAEVRTQIIHKTSDYRLRRKALREEMDLKALLTYGLTLEQSDRHSKLLEEDHKTPRQTNFIGDRKNQGRQGGYTAQDTKTRYNAQVKQSTQKYGNCGGSYPHIGGKSSCAQQLEKSVLNEEKSDILVNTVCQNNGNQQAHHVSTTTSNKSVIVIRTKNGNTTTEEKSVVCQNNN